MRQKGFFRPLRIMSGQLFLGVINPALMWILFLHRRSSKTGSSRSSPVHRPVTGRSSIGIQANCAAVMIAIYLLQWRSNMGNLRAIYRASVCRSAPVSGSVFAWGFRVKSAVRCCPVQISLSKSIALQQVNVHLCTQV